MRRAPRPAPPPAGPLASAIALALALAAAGCAVTEGPLTAKRGRCGDDACAASEGAPVGRAKRVVEGDVTVRTPADLEALRGAGAVTGTLAIQGVDRLETLEPLGELEEVGALRVTDDAALRSLHGLEGLRRVRGDLIVTRDPALASVEALASLTRVGGLLRLGEPDARPLEERAKGPVPSLDALTEVTLPALAEAGGVAVEGNAALTGLSAPALTKVGGAGLTVRHDPKLASLATAFPLLDRAEGPIVVGGGVKVIIADRVVNGRRTRVELGRVPAHDNDALESLELPALAVAGEIRVEGNPNLRKLLLPSLESAVDLSIVQAMRLREVRLAKLRRLGGGDGHTRGLRLSQVGVDFYAPLLAHVAGEVTLEELDAWADLTPLESLTEVRGVIHLFGNPALTSVRGLTRLRFAAAINAQYNTALKSIDGLTSLASTNFRVTVQGNEALERIALPKLSRMAGLIVSGEPSLGSVDLPDVEEVTQLFLEGCEALATVRAPKLARIGDFILSPGAGATLSTVALAALRETEGFMKIGDGVTSLSPFAAMERVGGDLVLRGATLPAAEVDAFVGQLKARRGIGGALDRAGASP